MPNEIAPSEGTPATPPVSGGSTPTPVVTPVPAPAAPTLTQEQIDKIVGERLADDRARRAKKLGLESWDQVEAEFDNAKKLKQAAMSDEERRNARLTELEQTNKALSDQHAADIAERDRKIALLEEERQEAAIRQAVESEARRLGFRYPEDAYLHANLAGVTLTDGKVMGADKAVEEVAKRRKDLLTTPPVPDINGRTGSAGTQANGFDVSSLIPATLRERIKQP